MRNRPHRLHVNVTERCNLRCVHCYRESYGANPDPSLATFDRVLSQFKELARSYHERGTHILTLGGGEPTVRADLESWIALSVRRGFRVRLVTNATLIDDERARALRRAGLKFAQVSLDGATEATHDRIRGKGAWKGAMAGIAALKRARVPTVLSYVLLPGLNLDEAPLLLNLTQELRLAGAKFARPVREGQAVVNDIAVDADYWTIFKRILDHGQAIGYRRWLFFFDPLAHLLRIEEPRRTAGLWGLATDLCQCNNTELVEVDASTGDVSYCRVRVRLGNVWKQTLSDIWHGNAVLNGIRRKTPVGACGGCKAWDACRGGCPAVVNGKVGDTLVQDADCYKVAAGGDELAFQALGAAHPRAIDNAEKIASGIRTLKNAVYWLAVH